MPAAETGVPEATFLNFLSGLATQGLMQLGAVANPLTGEHGVNLDYARYTVQLIKVLEAKTAGHRTPEEEQYLAALLNDLGGRLARAEADIA